MSGAGISACPACGGSLGSARLDLTFVARDPYHLCTDCGLLQARPDAAREAHFYAKVYPHLPHKRDEARGRLPVFASGLARIARRAKGLRLLDVGCGSGEFLALASSHGFRAEGVEVSAELVAEATRRSGCPVHPGGVEAVPRERAFDVVTLWNVLDQVTDPLALLQAVRARLAPSGLLFLRVPNGSIHRGLMRLTARVGARAIGWGLTGLTPFHPYLLRPADLRRLLVRAGYDRPELAGSPPTEGSAALPVRLLRGAVRIAARGVERATAGRAILSPSVEAWAGHGRS